VCWTSAAVRNSVHTCGAVWCSRLRCPGRLAHKLCLLTSMAHFNVLITLTKDGLFSGECVTGCNADRSNEPQLQDCFDLVNSR
jgi:hypothetical protein